MQSNPRPNRAAITADPTGVLLAMALRGGAITRERAVADRDARVAHWEPRLGKHDQRFIWTAQFAAAVDSAETAQAALAVLGRFGDPAPYLPDPMLLADEAIGRTFLLGGRAAASIPYLERAAKSCYQIRFPIEVTRASFYLGEARAATGDEAGACGAYRVVIDRWGNATPRSITAERARARATSLGCP